MWVLHFPTNLRKHFDQCKKKYCETRLNITTLPALKKTKKSSPINTASSKTPEARKKTPTSGVLK